MTTITVNLNGQPHELADDCTLAELLDRQQLAAHALATAVNGEFVPRARRPEHRLRDGDVVLGFQPIVGG